MTAIADLVLKAVDPEMPLMTRHRAFEAIVDHFQDMAYACAYANLGDYELARDAAQDSFISAWRNLEQLRDPAAFPGWFRRIVLTSCHRLTRIPTPLTSTDIIEQNLASPTANLQRIVEHTEIKDAVRGAVARLPLNERIVVTLFYLEEYSQADISSFLEVPTTTVAKRLYTARARLRDSMTRREREVFMAHRPSRTASFAEKVRQGIFDDYIGEYRYDARPDLTVLIKKDGDRLISESAGQVNELYSDDSDDELQTREFDGRGRFFRDRKGRISHFIYYEFGQEMGRARKVA